MKLRIIGNKSCRLCSLYEGVQSVCVPMRQLYRLHHDVPAQTAILFVGEAPGAEEDRTNKCFVGPSGKRLDAYYVHGPGLQHLADVYATNAVRCKLEADKPTAAQMSACRKYLELDIQFLSQLHARLLVIAVGAYAIRTLVDKTVEEQAANQFNRLWNLPNVYLLGTYHPEYLRREPRYEGLVMTLLLQARTWIINRRLKCETPPEPEISPRCTGTVHRLSLDLETYPCLDHGPVGTVFHPVRSRCLDHAPRDKQIVSAQIAWRDGKDRMHTGYFNYRNRRHRNRLRQWLQSCNTIVGQHLQYDLKYQRYNWRSLGYKIPPFFPIIDAMVEVYIYDDMLPRALKATAPLFGIASFLTDPAPVRAFKHGMDPRLIHYGCKDAFVAFRLVEIIDRLMREKFDPHVAGLKLSALRRRLFSDEIWCAVLMEEAGICYSLPALRSLEDQYRPAMKALSVMAAGVGYVITGKGSMASKSQLMTRAYRLIGQKDILNLKLLKSGNLSTDVDNRNALLGALDPTTTESKVLQLINELSGMEKILNSYVTPLLGKKVIDEIPITRLCSLICSGTGNESLSAKRIGVRHTFDRRSIALPLASNPNIGVNFPSWIILPRSKGNKSSSSGGTSQYRWSAKEGRPQVSPQDIKNCICSRHGCAGTILSFDLKQVEWRMAAYVSNDPVMLDEIANNIDPHVINAGFLLDVDLDDEVAVQNWVLRNRKSLNHSSNKTVRGVVAKLISNWNHGDYLTLRSEARQQAGKSPGFAYLYGGGGPVIKQTVRIKMGMDVPLSRCREFIYYNDRKYDRLAELRKSDINMALQYHAVHLPIYGLSRTFGGGEEAITGQYRGMIYDFRIQTTSFLLLMSIVITLTKELRRARLRSCIITNEHDGFRQDVWRPHIPQVKKLTERCARHNEFLLLLEQHYQRKFPLGYEIKLAT